MPIYAFQCDACGHAFDRLQKLSDADPATCPACGAGGQIRRQLTAPSFRLSGSGWYETDFKKDGDRKRNLAEYEGDIEVDEALLAALLRVTNAVAERVRALLAATPES